MNDFSDYNGLLREAKIPRSHALSGNAVPALRAERGNVRINLYRLTFKYE